MPGSDNPTGPYEYESEQPPSLTVVTALADLEGVETADLDSTLYDYIYLEALDKLGQSDDVELTFLVDQYTVQTTESSTIRITP